MGVAPEDSLIYKLFCEWFEDWDAVDNKNEWNKLICPFHNESRPSATISYDNDAFTCFACDWSGDALTLIQRKEDCGFHDSKRRAETILGRSYDKVQEKPKRKPRRIVFGEARPSNPRKPGGTLSFPDWIR